MKRVHLLIAALVVCIVALSCMSGETYAASGKKAVTASTAQATMATAAMGDKKAANKEKKAVPHDVNINTADQKLLTQLPGIGPATANSIVKYRTANGPFKSVDDLTKVKGIGDKSLAKLKPYLQAL